MERIILLGDSLFQRAFSQEKDSAGQIIGSFGPRLTDAYIRRLEVVNYGFSGFNTRQILSGLTSKFYAPSDDKPRPTNRLVIVFLGANDARLSDTPGGPQQHVPLEEFEKNLSMIVDSVKRHAKHVILIAPPPVDERQTVVADSKKNAELEGVVRRKAAVTKEYAARVVNIGREKDVTVLDLWSLMMEKAGFKSNGRVRSSNLDSEEYLDEYGKEIVDSETGPSIQALPGSSDAPVNDILRSYLHDGLHFTRKGYDLLFDELMRLIVDKLPEQLPERIPFVVPAWDDEKAWDGNMRSAADFEFPFTKDDITLIVALIVGIVMAAKFLQDVYKTWGDKGTFWSVVKLIVWVSVKMFMIHALGCLDSRQNNVDRGERSQKDFEALKEKLRSAVDSEVSNKEIIGFAVTIGWVMASMLLYTVYRESNGITSWGVVVFAGWIFCSVLFIYAIPAIESMPRSDGQEKGLQKRDANAKQ